MVVVVALEAVVVVAVFAPGEGQEEGLKNER